MPRKLSWQPDQPPRSRRSSTAMPPSFKAQVEKKARELVETVLKPRYVKPKPKNPKFNYIIDVKTKWLGSKLYFIATLACPRSAGNSSTFEWRFARMEHFGYQRFALSFMRHNDKWVRLYHGRTVDECLESIRDEPWFQLG